MRIVVSSIARFHHFDLARELQGRGALTAVFTGYPHFKLRDTGVDRRYIRTFPWLQAPYMALLRWPLFQRHMTDRWANWAQRALDVHVARNLPECDLVVAQCRAGVATGAAARRRGIVHVCDPGSAHTLFQDRLLREEHDRLGLPFPGMDPRAVERDLEEFATADAISVPSRFVYDSFRAQGVSEDRLILAPYGVDVRTFQRSEPRAEEFRVLFVGELGVQKGLHHLLRAFGLAGLRDSRLVLVGGATEAGQEILRRIPAAPLEVLGRQPWAAVIREMSRASVLVLPSVQDGFGMVMAQAMACGCPVIASEHTGARDLFTDGQEGFVVPIRDPEAIADRLRRLHGDRDLLDAMSAAALARTRSMDGWGEYGARLAAAYADLIRRRPSAGGGPGAGRSRVSSP